MRTAPELPRPLHHKSLAVLAEVRALLEACGRNRDTGCLKLEIHVNRGIPSRLTRCEERRREIPLESPS